MNLSAPFIRRPVMTLLVMLAILIAGFISFRQLPVSDLPNMEHPRIGVSASYTGATAETMVNLITIPLEKELVNVSGLKEISSTSARGKADIILDFGFNKDLDVAAREVQAALIRAETSLPKDMSRRPTYYKQEANNEHMMFLILTSNTASIAELREYADVYITPLLTRIEGVAKIDTFGAPYSIKIRLNPDLMAARHVGLDQVVQAIQQQNAELPLGSIKTGTRTMTIELSGRFQNAKDFENLVVAKGPVRLKDIGTATDELSKDQEIRFLTKDKSSLALILGLKKISGANTVAISEAVNQYLPEIKKDLPPSMQLNLWFDKATWIHESISDVEWSLFFAFVLVVLVIFFSLGRFSEAMIPSVALPMSLIGTLVAMYGLHFSLDILSLLALTLAVGFVVDDAIVVLENIVRHNENGKPPMEASLIGSKEICFTILSMTLSLVAVFVPLLFMGGMNGRLFREFSVTLAIAIIISGFISLTLTPMLCSRLLTTHDKATRLQLGVTRLNKWMVGKYEVSLRWCLKHPKTITMVALACFLATIPLFRTLPINLFPDEDRGFIISIVNLPKGVSSSQRVKYQNKLEKMLQANPNIESFIDLKWEGIQLFVVNLLPHNQREPQPLVVKQIQDSFDSVPGTQSYTKGWQLINVAVEGLNGGSYEYVVRGMENHDVLMAAESLKKAMQGTSDFPFVNLNVKNDDPKLVVKVQEEQAHKYGFTKKEIQSVLQQAYGGSSVATIQKGGKQFKVNLELASEFQDSPSGLGKLYLKSSKGVHVPLKSLVSWSETLGAPTFYRVDQLPSATVSFSMNNALPVNKGLEKLEHLAKDVLPYNVKGKLQGAAALVASTMQDTTLLILASVVVMYIVLGILYESFIHPLTILSSLPFAGLGGVLTLILFGQSLTLFSIVGFLLLIGIVKKNGIMMIDYALERRKNDGIHAEEAILEGCLVRFRPIMMTTVAAIMGALPIAIGFGEGAETRRGLGLVIVGGLLFSQVLTLYATPVLYLMFDKLKTVGRRRKDVVVSALSD